jgi:hypothetical protein
MATAFDPSRYLVKTPGAVQPLQRTTPAFDPTLYGADSPLAKRSSVSSAITAVPGTDMTNPDPTSTEVTYGFGSGGAGLTAAQQKVSDSVQNSFANSLAQRDRDLQRYQMPQLSSFTEDEALQRAIATANLANQQTNPLGITGGGGGGGGRSGGGGGGFGGGGGAGAGVPRTSTVAAPHPSWIAKAGQLLDGVLKWGPLMLGKDTMDALMKKGIFGFAKDGFNHLFAQDANGRLMGGPITPESFATMILPNDVPAGAVTNQFLTGTGTLAEPSPNFPGYGSGAYAAPAFGAQNPFGPQPDYYNNYNYSVDPNAWGPSQYDVAPDNWDLQGVPTTWDTTPGVDWTGWQ